MKLLYVLPVLMALPMGAFADYGNYLLRPFVGYNVSLARFNHSSTEYNGHNLVKSDEFALNNENLGEFVFGFEISDIMEVSIMPSINNVTYNIAGVGKETTKYNELDLGVDFFLTKNQKYKPFVSLELGYIDMDDSTKTSGAIFGIGFGCKKYFDNKIYLGANIGYAFSTKMNVSKMDDTHVHDMIMQISGVNLSFEVGYRF